ncbi:terminase gpA endonuclease subunit [Brachyspira hyodysenteriae]|uniref:terminase gpA endonuclease subunit n=1 Tax=Brachyspira hyodysenteriae TaxID=159 RepID=UPI00063D94BF|nr:terminase gpA endonuclease subunit [Brachyspira hyodysenteriae]KLI46142.1 hypothetical protein SZ41_12300 [Brachyspira hyodysenteriae]KLI53617.1 hypothetical protein SZ42_00565 [Brachyspira hyodysenteriae]
MNINLEDIILKEKLIEWHNKDISFVKKIILRCLAPREKKNIIEFVESKRLLSSSVTSRPGYYSFKITPYLKDILKDLDERSPIQYVDFMKGSQIGSTVGLDENLMIYLIANSPAPILFLASTAEVAEKIFSSRINRSIYDSGFGNLIKSPIKSKKNKESGETKSLKMFEGGFVEIGGLQTISKLKSTSVKVLIITEADDAKSDVSGQGNAIDLAEVRTDSFSLTKKILVESTPKMSSDESFIEKRFLQGDQRYYHVPCKDCGELQILEFKRLKYELDDKGFLIPSSVHYECKYCGSHWKEIDKNYFLQLEEDGGKAKWIPTSKSDDPLRRSYHLSALYAPVGFKSWIKIITQYLRALEAEKNGDNQYIKVFYNTVLGETYKSYEEAPPYHNIFNKNRDNYLRERINEYGEITQSTLDIENLPYKPLFCNIAADIQKNYIEVGVFLWCEGYRSYLIGYHRLDGNTSNLNSRCWKLLEILIKSSHLDLYPSMIFIDKGFIPATVTDFCENIHNQLKVNGNIIFPIKGDSTGKLFRKQETNENKKPYSLIINSNIAKEEVYSALALELTEEEPLPPRWAYFPNDLNIDFFRMLTAEEKIRKHLPSGKVKYDWVLRAGQKRNEALDIFAYSTAAAFFYIDNIAHKDKKGYINYKALWNYLSSSGAWFEHLDKFAEKEESNDKEVKNKK